MGSPSQWAKFSSAVLNVPGSYDQCGPPYCSKVLFIFFQSGFESLDSLACRAVVTAKMSATGAPEVVVPATVEVSASDTSFMLISAAFVMFMTPGLSLFYGGLAGRRSVISVMIQSFISLALISVLWFVYGYSLSFGADAGGIIGNLKKCFLIDVGMNDLFYLTKIPELVMFVYQMVCHHKRPETTLSFLSLQLCCNGFFPEMHVSLSTCAVDCEFPRTVTHVCSDVALSAVDVLSLAFLRSNCNLVLFQLQASSSCLLLRCSLPSPQP